MANPHERTTVAIAGAGDVAKYLVEELLAGKHFNIVVLSRAPREWFSNQAGVDLRITDYTQASLQSILDSTGTSVLFSFLHSNDPSFYNTVHEAMLAACRESRTCKRFVPSEYGGNLRTHPLLPRFYEPTHAAFRNVLAAQHHVRWTLVNIGWFMDYFVPTERSYMKPLHPVWPVDIDKWQAVVLGTGEEKIAWTSARDVCKALVRLIEFEEWEKETYVCGEIGTWNDAIKKVGAFYGPRLNKGEMKKESLPKEKILRAPDEHKDDQDKTLLWKAYMDEWNITGASAVPWDLVLEQREKYFCGIKFRTVQELMEDAEKMEKV